MCRCFRGKDSSSIRVHECCINYREGPPGGATFCIYTESVQRGLLPTRRRCICVCYQDRVLYLRLQMGRSTVCHRERGRGQRSLLGYPIFIPWRDQTSIVH